MIKEEDVSLGHPPGSRPLSAVIAIEVLEGIDVGQGTLNVLVVRDPVREFLQCRRKTHCGDARLYVV
jgi:hypothetical protein